MVLAGQAIKRERLLDVLLDPGAELGIGRLPLGEPGRQIAPGFGEITAVVQPAQLAQAVVVDLAGHIVERVAQEVHVTALPCGLRQDLDDRLAEPGMVVGDHELDACEAALAQPQ